MDAIPPLGICMEPVDVLAKLGVDLGRAGPAKAPVALEQLAHETPSGGDAACDVGEAAKEALEGPPRHAGMGEPAVTLLEDCSELVFGDAECHSLRADLEAEPNEVGDLGHAFVEVEA